MMGKIINEICMYNPKFTDELDELLKKREPELPKAEKAILANQMAQTPYSEDMPFEDCIAIVLRSFKAIPKGYKVEICPEGEDKPDEVLRWGRKDIIRDRFSYLNRYGDIFGALDI